MRRTHITFHVHDAEKACDGVAGYDVAILSDIIDHITDVLNLYGAVNASLRVGGRMCVTTINPLWDPIFYSKKKLGQKMPEGEHNFVPNRDLAAFLKLRGFRLVSTGALMLVPRDIPYISDPINRWAPRIPLIRNLCVVQTLVAEKTEDYVPVVQTELSLFRGHSMPQRGRKHC